MSLMMLMYVGVVNFRCFCCTLILLLLYINVVVVC